MKIIAITGTIGAGKNTLVDFLKREGYAHFSVRKLLVEKLKMMELYQSRENMVNLANDIRRKFGPAHLIETLLNEVEKSGKNAVIESIRTLGEVKLLKERRIPLWAVDATQYLRYHRIKARASSTDDVSLEQFIEDEKRESTEKNEWTQNLPGCIASADVLFLNNKTIADLEDEVGLYLARFQRVNL